MLIDPSAGSGRTTQPGRRTAIIEALGTVIIWGATFVATKLALQEASPATVVWLRFGMGLLVLGWAARRRGELSLPLPEDRGYLILLGFLGVAFHQWLQSNGLMTARATTTAWIVATTPVFIAVLGYAALHERLRPLQWAGIVGAALGVLVIVSQGQPAQLLAGEVATTGDLLILISSLNWAVYTILSRRGLARMPAGGMILSVMASGWIFISIWLFGFGPGLSELGELSLRAWLAIGALGLLGSGLAYVMYYDALRVLPASQLGVFLNVEPLVTALLAAPLLGEAMTLAVMVGGGLILLGIYLVNRKGPSPLPGEGRNAET